MKRLPPGPAGERPEASLKTFLALLKNVWPDDRPDLKIRVVLALVALLLSKVISGIAPFFYKNAVDVLSASGVDAVILVPVGLIVAAGVARIFVVAFAQARDAFAARVVQHAVRRVAITTFRHIHNLSLRFHLERRTGGLSRVIERGNNAIDIIIRFLLFNTVPTLVEILIVGGILAVYLSWTFTAVLFATIIAYVAFTAMVTEWRVAIRRQMNEADTEAYGKAVDSLLNYETVKYFGNETHEAKRFDASMAEYEDAAVRTTTSLSVLNAGQTLIFTAGMTICMLMAGFGVADGSLTVGDFVLVNAYFIQIYIPLNFLGTVHREVKQGLVDLERLFNLQSKAPEIRDVTGAPELAVTGGAITFEAVAFSYDADRQILDALDFTVPAGRTYAIVGPSGVGKSTISRLLYRFYDPNSGRILIDGQDISEVTQQSLRAAIGMVPQDTVLFNDTIGYNIAYGRPGATAEEIVAAARAAQVDDFVSKLPAGYDTLVGERGLKLSGGEKQRVAIARTILKAPPILILDEATSALDSFTEREIQSALAAVSRGRTTLVIAHRLSTIIDADQILVLKAGRVAERGRHDQLLAMDGLYAALWRRQLEAAEAEAIVSMAAGAFPGGLNGPSGPSGNVDTGDTPAPGVVLSDALDEEPEALMPPPGPK
ncbi:Efflux ABC transporter, permease/ATP-binding protein mlr7818 [hydrothermal vent metagenome]|uniref:Efflux ABC transporter, permease/ATP-binding protein mlr7818 n=1 Tax=hydrothermal vent metagenome TaxID=652676 RepID=A0A3B0TCZ2_9ZZZZ